MLSDRRQQVLAALIEEYVARALPVGSRTLSENYHFGVSSATIRNELSALEEEGYVTQPHTSAGRIPTDNGYRAFVDKIVESGELKDDPEARETVSEMKRCAQELDELMVKTSEALARLTSCLSIVSSTDGSHAHKLGMSSLMCQPEFIYTQSLIPIMQALENDTILLQILDGTSADEMPYVRIGTENQSEQLQGVSVIASRFEGEDGEGVVAVIGPTRMNYSKVLQAVRLATQALNEE